MTSLVLKIIACLAMLCDHLAVGMKHGGYLIDVGFPCVYSVMRLIGRIAFPIFIFLMAEGIYHTKNREKYLLRLGIFAFISEIPFNLLAGESVIFLSGQNVFFTLFLGFLGVYLFKRCEEIKNTAAGIALRIAAVLGCIALGGILKTDYGSIGVTAIVFPGLISLYREKISDILSIPTRVLSVMAAFTSASILAVGYGGTEIAAIFAVLPIMLYNGKKGYENKALKYGFYVFYPLHILVIGLFSVLCKIA